MTLAGGLILHFLVVLTRISAIFVSTPFLSVRSIPSTFRAALLMMLTVAILPVTPEPAPVNGVLGLVLLLGGEVIVGASIGFAWSTVFQIAATGGHLIGLSLNYSYPLNSDPLAAAPEALTDQLYAILMMLVLFLTNGHLLVIWSIAHSFSVLPPGHLVLHAGALGVLVGLGSQLFVTSVTLALPIMASQLLADTVLALLSRSVPQLNIFSIEFVVKPLLGLAVLVVTLPLTVGILSQLSGSYRAVADQILTQLH